MKLEAEFVNPYQPKEDRMKKKTNVDKISCREGKTAREEMGELLKKDKLNRNLNL